MKDLLAEQLLAQIMKWKENEVEAELVPIQYMAYTKYDNYDQFMPGARFIGSFAKWLNMFDPNERGIMFEFVKKKLIFISSTQMYYLVTLLYNTKIKNAIAEKVAKQESIPRYKIRKIELSEQYERHKRMSLFVGLSDGAHMDILRRVSGLNNEQVLTNYFPDDEKIRDLVDGLNKSPFLMKIKEERRFEALFLIDDFTASGSSFIRKYENGSIPEYKGKLRKIIDKITCNNNHHEEMGQQVSQDPDFNFKNLFGSKLTIYVMFCIATQYALDNIKKRLNEYLEINNLNGRLVFQVDAVQIIGNDISNQIKKDKDLMAIIAKNKYFNKEVLTESYKNGHHNQPHLGYDECSLPLVLSHNTPNNSLPILWQPSEEKYPSLFPRINRH